MSGRVSMGVRARTTSVSWPIHSPAAGPRATAPTMTLSFVPAAGLRRPGRGRSYAERRPPSILCDAVTTWSPTAVPTDATCGSLNTAAASLR
jgi:hypothetical protein